ncbi:MAG TPA: efflux RND transporter periplasmic adaptor subunit [Bacteroidales bacterium]|nr:efflux RND transporter periplasmic adaptor subunit [Bacteroidales bacterium]
MKKKTWIIIAIAVVAVLIVLAVLKNKGAIGAKSGVKVTTEKVTRRTIVETVSANGKIQPEKEVKITPYISGEVVELKVREGDEVSEGDLLAKIDPEIYRSNYERSEAGLQSQRAAVANSRARLVQSEAQFTSAQLSFDRNKKLWEEKVISNAEYETALSQYEVAKAEVQAAKENVKSAEFQVASAEASLRESRENLTKTAIYAPSDGTISKLIVEKGERVSGASQFSAGTELMRIANLNSMEAVVQVNENDIVRVHLNDTALIEVDAYLNRKFKGLVTEIATSADVTGVSADQVTNFQVKIRLLKESYDDLIPDNNPFYSPFRPGMSTTVDIQTKREGNVLTVPIQAVTTRADTTGKTLSGSRQAQTQGGDGEIKSVSQKSSEEKITEYVFLIEDGKARIAAVKSGVQDNTNIQIVEGLEEDQEVITGPYRAVSRTLENGQDVQVVSKDKLYDEK